MSGTQLLAHWEGRAGPAWAAAWRIPGLHVLERTGSTNDVLRELALGGAAAGTTVIAEHQSAGRGRLGRSWEAPPRSALLCSVLLRPAGGAPEASAALPLRIGLAIADALQASAGVAAMLKWPNDVLLGGRKVAGILCEAAAGYVIAGIGINVTREAGHVPGADPPATSLAAGAGREVARAAVAGALLAALQPLFHAPHRALDEDERTRYAARDALLGRAVTIDGTAAGIARGLDPSGALLLERAGILRPIHAGTVRISP